MSPSASHFFRFSTASKEQWVNQLEGWRQCAEESGILALQEFSRKLRCYN